jgi:hypothetical protein
MGKVLSTQGSGYFPQCIIDSDVGIYSLEDAMKIYWRVRTWTYSVSISAIGQGDCPILYGNDSFIIGSSANREEQLVCGGNSFYGSKFYPESTFIGAAEINFFSRVYKNGNKYAGIQISINLGGLPSQCAPFFTNVIYSDQSYEGGRFDSTILGEKIKLKGDFGNDPPVSLFDVISFNAEFTPNSYWSYGGTYNTTTGQPL